MKHNRLFLTILCIPFMLITSCKKEIIVKGNFKPTIISVTMQHDADNMPINQAFNCYKQDSAYSYDSNWVYSSLTPDTLALKFYFRMDSHHKTGRVDSSFVSFGQTVYLTGPIEHREYTFVGKINKITYGTD